MPIVFIDAFLLMASVIFGTLAEWLRRGPAKAVGYACVSSNLTGVVVHFFSFFLHSKQRKTRGISETFSSI